MDKMNTLLRCASIGIICLFLTCLLTGCAATSQIHDYCQIAHPIRLAKGEAAKLSDATAREILTHNEQWAKVCGK